MKGAFRKESHAHRGRCTGSRTARDIALTPSARMLLGKEDFSIASGLFGTNIYGRKYLYSMED